MADVNGDGYPDVIVACELEHLIYLQNPAASARTSRWERIIPPIANDRGSYMRVFFADFDLSGDEELDIVIASGNSLVWLEQPASPSQAWRLHRIGSNNSGAGPPGRKSTSSAPRLVSASCGGCSRCVESAATSHGRLGTPGESGTW